MNAVCVNQSTPALPSVAIVLSVIALAVAVAAYLFVRR
jgi:hypothetical protein